jgi:hypothetical protein
MFYRLSLLHHDFFLLDRQNVPEQQQLDSLKFVDMHTIVKGNTHLEFEAVVELTYQCSNPAVPTVALQSLAALHRLENPQH